MQGRYDENFQLNGELLNVPEENRTEIYTINYYLQCDCKHA